MSEANKRQVGGEHYKGTDYEVWDYLVDHRFRYLDGSIVKYVCRWRRKGGLDDLRKAAHCAEKLVETLLADASQAIQLRSHLAGFKCRPPKFRQLKKSMGLTDKESAIVWLFSTWRDCWDLLRAEALLKEFVKEQEGAAA